MHELVALQAWIKNGRQQDKIDKKVPNLPTLNPSAIGMTIGMTGIQ
jgi:hypothetical protein